MKKLILACIIISVSLMTLYYATIPTHLATPPVVPDMSLTKILLANRLILGVDKNFPPMSFVDNDDVVGFDIDVMKEACRRLNIHLVVKLIDWGKKEELLERGKIDCIGSMSVVPEAKRVMCLSEPYIRESLVFVVPGNSEIDWLSDLKGKKVGVQEGSTTQEAIEKLTVYKDISIVLFDDNIEILHAIAKEELDAGLVDSVAAYYYISLHEKSFYILSEITGEEEFALGFRKSDKTLRNTIQNIISEMKTDGTIDKISTEWFGSDITLIPYTEYRGSSNDEGQE